MATVTNTVKLPDGSTPDRVDVVIELVASTTGRAAGWITATDVTLEATVRPTVTNGAWTASLTPNASGSLSFYRNPAEKNAAATGIAQGKMIDVEG